MHPGAVGGIERDVAHAHQHLAILRLPDQQLCVCVFLRSVSLSATPSPGTEVAVAATGAPDGGPEAAAGRGRGCASCRSSFRRRTSADRRRGGFCGLHRPVPPSMVAVAASSCAAATVRAGELAEPVGMALAGAAGPADRSARPRRCRGNHHGQRPPSTVVGPVLMPTAPSPAWADWDSADRWSCTATAWP